MKLEGVYPALVTPFNASGELDLDALGRVLDFVIAAGAAGIVVLGSTGEFYACSDAERRQVLAHAHEIVAGRVPLIAGTNAAGTREVITHTRGAREIGYDAVLLAPPFYALPSQRELARHFQTVLEAVDIPVVLYNFPARTGVGIGYEVLDALVEDPNLIGIKESSGDIGRLHGLLERYGRLGDAFTVICGCDDQILEYCAWGVRAWIGGAASFAPREHVAVLEAALAGDLAAARTQLQRLLPLLASMEGGGYTQKAKLGCALAGVPVGDTRPPLYPLAADERDAFAALYARWLG